MGMSIKEEKNSCNKLIPYCLLSMFKIHQRKHIKATCLPRSSEKRRNNERTENQKFNWNERKGNTRLDKGTCEYLVTLDICHW
jgi:hypothetical protein